MCKWGTNTIVKLCRPVKNAAGIVSDVRAVDSCIADIVQALNDGGMLTRASCCGHGKITGSIVLDDRRELQIARKGGPNDP